MAGEKSPRHTLRLSRADQDALNRICETHGLSTTQGLRMAVRFADSKRVLRDAPKHIDALADANNQIRRLGINLNQITRSINATDLDDPNITTYIERITELIPEIRETKNELQRLLRESRSL